MRDFHFERNKIKNECMRRNEFMLTVKLVYILIEDFINQKKLFWMVASSALIEHEAY